jgi:hypothetical protein
MHIANLCCSHDASPSNVIARDWRSQVTGYGEKEYDVQHVFAELGKAWYNVQRVSYEGHALFPLFRLAVSDLPADSRISTLVDENTKGLLEGEGGRQ